MANGNFDFQLPDGRVIRVEGAPSEEAARSFMDTQWDRLRRQMPIEGFFESAGQQFRGQFGAFPGAAQAAAAAAGAPETAEFFGRGRTLLAPGDTRPGTRAPELGDIVRNPIDALTAFAGQAAGSVAGALGAAAGGALIGGAAGAAGLNPATAAGGAVIGAASAAAVGGIDELYQGLVAEGVDPQLAGAVAIPVGALIGRFENRYVTDALTRALRGKVDDSVINRVTQRFIGGRPGGIRQTAAGGALSETAGEAARQTTIGAVTGEANLPERLSRVGEAAIVGGLAGTGVGAVTRLTGGAPAPETAPPEGGPPAPTPTPEPPPEPAPAPRMAPLTVPERPEPLATREEAEAFVAANPTATPPISPETNPTAYVNLVNAARLGLWEQSVTETKTRAVNDFFPRAPDTQQIVVPDTLSNLAEAAGRGDLNLNAFSPNAVARAALASRDIDPNQVTPDQVSAAARQLEALADTGVIRRNVTETTSTEKGKKVKRRKTTYAVNFGARPEAQPAPAPTAAPEAAARPEVIPPAAEGAPVPQAAPTPAAPPAAPPTGVNDSAGTGLGIGDRVRTTSETGNVNEWAVDRVVETPRGPRVVLRGSDNRTVSLGAGEIASRPNRLLRIAPTAPVAAPAAPAQPTARTTVEVDGVRRETTPETLQQTVDEMRTAPPTPEEAELAQAAAQTDPASGAGQTTRTAEEAILATPKNMPIKEQQRVLDQQVKTLFAGPNDGFRGGTLRRLLASSLTGLGRQPIYQQIADIGTRMVDRKYGAAVDFANALEALRALPAESQARAVLALQDSRSRQEMWDRNAFTAEENAAMDGVIAAGQRGLDLLIDAFTRKFFDPSRAKTPDARARLEAFQRAKGDRPITAFSDAELRALSEEGAKQVRTYNAKRDKFFMPQVARGSHFVAAYKKLPGGKKQLVRIYFYNPLSFAQRQRQRVGAQRDFEALSIQALRQEFPDTNRFEIMTQGREATRDEQARGLRASGEFISDYLQRLSKVSSRDAQRILDQMAAEIDKASMDRFFKRNDDKLRAVTPWNAVDYARETLPNYYLALANIQAREAYKDEFKRAQEGFTSEEQKYWNDWLNISSTPVEAFGAGRAVAAAWFLGFNVSSAMMQLTQNIVTLPARFARDGAGLAGSGQALKAAVRDVYGAADLLTVFGKELDYSNKVASRAGLSAPVSAALKRAIEEGVVRPAQLVAMRGQFDADNFRTLGIADTSAAAFADKANKLVDVSFRMLSTVDETNRLVAFLAAYRLAESRPEVLSRAGRLDNRVYKDAYEYARSVVDETNFRGGIEDQPLITRFHPVAQVVTQFLTPSFKFFELFGRSAAMAIDGMKQSDPTMAKAGAVMFGLMMASQIALAGVWSLPFADRLKELTEFILSKAFDTELDFEQEIEKLPITSLWAAIANFGLPHAANVATLSERLKIDVLPSGSISEWDVFSLLGPVGGLLEKPAVALGAYEKGDYWGIAYALLPTSTANVLKGIQIGATGEQFTRAGGRIITPEQVAEVSRNSYISPALRQAIGFAPPEFADIRRAVRRAQEMREPLQRDTERANSELARILLRQYEAQIEGRSAEARTLSQQFEQRAAEIMREQEGKPEQFRVRLSRSAIEQRARQDLQGRGSLETLLRRAPAAQRPEIIRMYERTIRPPAD